MRGKGQAKEHRSGSVRGLSVLSVQMENAKNADAKWQLLSGAAAMGKRAVGYRPRDRGRDGSRSYVGPFSYLLRATSLVITGKNLYARLGLSVKATVFATGSMTHSRLSIQ